MAEVLRTRIKEDIEEDVGRLKEWLYKQPHLPHDVEPELLTAFVHGTKTLEIAKKKLDAYYTVRNRALDLYDFKNRDPTSERFQELCKSSERFFLPKTTPDGCRVIMVRFIKEHYDLFDIYNTTSRIMMLFELALMRWPDAPGYYLVEDVKNLQASFATKMSPSVLASALHCYHEGYPVKVKGIFIINSPPFVEFLVNTLFKPVLKEKLFNRVKITTQDISAIYDSIPQDILPSDFGGGKEKTAAELNEYWMNQLIEQKSWWEHTSKQISDETKRPPDGSNAYGIEGTFRKLAVD